MCSGFCAVRMGRRQRQAPDDGRAASVVGCCCDGCRQLKHCDLTCVRGLSERTLQQFVFSSSFSAVLALLYTSGVQLHNNHNSNSNHHHILLQHSWTPNSRRRLTCAMQPSIHCAVLKAECVMPKVTTRVVTSRSTALTCPWLHI